MRKGQKISKNGYQLIGFPMEVMNITQSNNEGTHLGTNALDNAGSGPGIEETIVPFDMVFKAYDTQANGNAVWFESFKPVGFRDGTIDYAVIMALHDNYIGDILALARKGYVFKQGETFGDEGTAGRAFGNHLHFEIAKGKFTHCYDRNPQGVWHLPNNVSADLACVTDGTNILNKGKFINWTDSSKIFENQSSNNDLLSLTIDVMSGKYGVGSERKKKLGSSYAEVQNFINHIYTSSAERLVSEVMSGMYGTGRTRKLVLGPRYNEVQSIINKRY